MLLPTDVSQTHGIRGGAAPAPERGNMELVNKILDVLLAFAIGATSMLLIMLCITGIVVFGCAIYEFISDAINR